MNDLLKFEIPSEYCPKCGTPLKIHIQIATKSINSDILYSDIYNVSSKIVKIEPCENCGYRREVKENE